MRKNIKKLDLLVPDAYEEMLMPLRGAETGVWAKLDSLLGGWRPREYTILCGPTGAGKTAWLAALADKLVGNGVPTYVASVETGPVDFVKRMMSARAKRNWNRGNAVPLDQIQAFQSKEPGYSRQPLYLSLYEDRIPNKELLDDIKFAVEEHGVKVAILDNLNFFMEVSRSSDTIIEMDRVVHDMIIFCKKVDVHIICVMHPKKTDHGQVLSEFDIKGSSTAVQESHNVLLYNKLSKDELEADVTGRLRNYRFLTIAKCRRRGDAVGSTISYRGIEGVDFIEENPPNYGNTDTRY